jgi:hypothetical protein
MRTAIVVAFLSAVPALAHAGEFAYRFPEGEVLRYAYRADESLAYKAKTGKVVEVRATEYTLEISPNAQGGWSDSLKTVFRDLKTIVSSPEIQVEFDSRKTCSPAAVEKQPLLGILSGIPGDSFGLQLTPAGSVAAVSGFLKMHARAASRGLTGSKFLEKVFEKAFAEFLSDETMRSGLRMVIVPAPPELKAGVEWTQDVSTDFGDGVREIHRFRYKLASVSATRANIAMQGTVRLSAGGEDIPKDGELAGSAVFDLEAGRILSCQVRSSIKLPNLSLANAFEFKFQKSLTPSEAGPESFEKPLRSLLALIERRRVKGEADLPVAVYSTDQCQEAVFFAHMGDIVRVVAKQSGPNGPCVRVVTALGREGWMLEQDTEPLKG